MHRSTQERERIGRRPRVGVQVRSGPTGDPLSSVPQVPLAVRPSVPS